MRKNGLTRLFSVILALALMLTTMPFSAITVNAVTNEFAGGSGTENDPYLISTKQHLNNVRNHLTSFASPYFELTNDIVFEDGDFAVGGEYYNEGKLWLPIGHNTLFNFSGTFDGNGFSIINLKINGQATEHGRYGLFSECAGTIKNLSIKNANITVSGEVGPYYVGGLVGELTVYTGSSEKYGLVENCSFDGNIITSSTDFWNCAAGIVGYASNDTKTINCHNYGEITSQLHASGIVCENNGLISNCSNNGEIVLSDSDSNFTTGIGGICATNHQTIENSYNTGNITVESFTGYHGGIVGENRSITRNCYNMGTVTAFSAGGIAGDNVHGTISNCYNVGIINGEYKSGGIVSSVFSGSVNDCYCLEDSTGFGTIITIPDLQNKELLSYLDFNDIWEFVEGNLYVYPTLKNNPHYILSDNEFQGGLGTEESPYLIASANQLNNVRNHLSSHYRLVRNIDFKNSDFAEGGTFYNDGKGWLPIKKSYTYFTGVFDGNGHTINNLHINYDNTTYTKTGLFSVNSGTIKNLGMVLSEINIISPNSSAYVGGIAGENEGVISECYNTGNIYVESTHSVVGGIVGHNESGGEVINSYNTGTVISKNPTSSSSWGAGIAGINYHKVLNCYNVGYITSDSSTGAIVGMNGSSSDVQVTNCYYSDNVKKGEGVGTTYSTKLTLEEMKLQSSFTGFDFNSIWEISSDSEYKYPVLVHTPMNFIKTFTGILVSQTPYRTQYYKNIEDFNVEGGKLLLLYNDGTSTEIDITSDMVSSYDKTAIGVQTITVTYLGKTATFDVECLEYEYVGNIIASGECGLYGDNLTWQIDSSNTLTISGEGEMANYSWTNWVPTTPWYEYRDSIKKIVVKDGVTSIGSCAFYKLNKATKVTISNDVISFGWEAFYQCANLTYIDYPKNLQKIGNGCFSDCDKLRSAKIPDSVTDLGTSVFSYCSNFESIVFPVGINRLPNAFFYECESLKTIAIPDTVKAIGGNCFYGCINLEKVYFPSALESIEFGVFYGCTKLKDMFLPNNVTTLGNQVFYGCSGLEQLQLPESLTTIPSEMCYNCSELTEVTVPYSVKSIEQRAFYGCTKLKSISLPNGLEKIEKEAFFKCFDLVNILLPNSLISIKENAYGLYRNSQNILTVVPNARIYCYENSVAETYAKTNNIPYSLIRIIINASDCEYTGQAVEPSVEIIIDQIKLQKDVDFTISYENNVNKGTGSANIKFIGDYSSIEGTLKQYFRIGKLVSKCDIDLDKEKYQYHTLLPKVDISSNEQVLNIGSDYELYYSLAGETWKKPTNGTSRYIWDIGKLEVKIIGIGDYIGEHIIEVNVEKFNMSNAGLSTTWTYEGNGSYGSTSYDMKNFEYDGTEKKQSGFRVCDPNDTIDSINYDITYKNNVNVGTATMIITGKGDYYTGKLEKQFEIYPRAISSISVSKKPTKTIYKKGDSIDVSGGKITVYYQDGGQETINMTANMLDGSYNLSMDGIQNIWINYKGASTYFEITVKNIVKGDCNGDGKITITDMLAIKSHILGKSSLSGDLAQAADTNKDGKITITDFIQVKAHILGKSSLS